MSDYYEMDDLFGRVIHKSDIGLYTSPSEDFEQFLFEAPLVIEWNSSSRDCDGGHSGYAYQWATDLTYVHDDMSLRAAAKAVFGRNLWLPDSWDAPSIRMRVETVTKPDYLWRVDGDNYTLDRIIDVVHVVGYTMEQSRETEEGYSSEAVTVWQHPDKMYEVGDSGQRDQYAEMMGY